MRPTRCPCGVLVSFLRPCKRCGRALHHAHGHPPDDDPGHFEDVTHEWFHTGGRHRDPDLPPSEWERCPYVHTHPLPFAGHDHDPATGAAVWDDETAARLLAQDVDPRLADMKEDA